MKKREISGAARILGYKNRAVEYWDITKYKDNYKLLCTVNALTDKGEKIRACDMIGDYGGKEAYLNQFEVHMNKKKLIEIYNMLKYKMELWGLDK